MAIGNPTGVVRIPIPHQAPMDDLDATDPDIVLFLRSDAAFNSGLFPAEILTANAGAPVEPDGGVSIRAAVAQVPTADEERDIWVVEWSNTTGSRYLAVRMRAADFLSASIAGHVDLFIFLGTGLTGADSDTTRNTVFGEFSAAWLVGERLYATTPNVEDLTGNGYDMSAVSGAADQVQTDWAVKRAWQVQSAGSFQVATAIDAGTVDALPGASEDYTFVTVHEWSKAASGSTWNLYVFDAGVTNGTITLYNNDSDLGIDHVGTGFFTFAFPSAVEGTPGVVVSGYSRDSGQVTATVNGSETGSAANAAGVTAANQFAINGQPGTTDPLLFHGRMLSAASTAWFRLLTANVKNDWGSLFSSAPWWGTAEYLSATVDRTIVFEALPDLTEVRVFEKPHPHRFEVRTIADSSGSLAGAHFLFNLFNGASETQYYAWFRVSGSGSDPAVAGRTGVVVDIATDDSADAVATALGSAVDALPLATASAAGDAVTVTGANNGLATAPEPGDAGFTVTDIWQGNESDVSPIDGIENSSGGTFVANYSVQRPRLVRVVLHNIGNYPTVPGYYHQDFNETLTLAGRTINAAPLMRPNNVFRNP